MPVSTSAPRRLLHSTSLPPKLPTAQPFIRTSAKQVVDKGDINVNGKKRGKEAVIRVVSTVSPRPFISKVFKEISHSKS